MRGAEGDQRREARFPPFLLAHHHQARDAVDLARAPVGIWRAAAGEVGLRCVALDREDRERALRRPRGEIPRERCARRMPHRHDGRGGEFVVAGNGGEFAQQGVAALAGAAMKIERPVERRRDEHLRDAERGECAAHRRVLEDALLDHVVLRHDHGAHPRAVLGNPEKRAPLAHRHGPLPHGVAGARERSGEEGQKKRKERKKGAARPCRRRHRSGVAAEVTRLWCATS